MTPPQLLFPSPPFPRVPFYFMRHGQSTANQDMIWAGWTDSALTDLGVQQAQEARQLVQTLSLSHVYHSPLQRAAITATTATKGMGLNYTSDPDLREANFGKYEGECYTMGCIMEWLDGTYTDQNMGLSPCNHRGESFQTLQNRVNTALNTILSNHTTGHPPLVVCHGGVHAAICAILGHKNLTVELPNCGVMHFNPMDCGTGNCGDWQLDLLFPQD